MIPTNTSFTSLKVECAAFVLLWRLPGCRIGWFAGSREHYIGTLTQAVAGILLYAQQPLLPPLCFPYGKSLPEEGET